MQVLKFINTPFPLIFAWKSTPFLFKNTDLFIFKNTPYLNKDVNEKCVSRFTHSWSLSVLKKNPFLVKTRTCEVYKNNSFPHENENADAYHFTYIVQGPGTCYRWSKTDNVQFDRDLQAKVKVDITIDILKPPIFVSRFSRV